MVYEWEFVDEPKNSGIGHGLLLFRNEVSMNMAKLAFASVVRVKDAKGEDSIPAIQEAVKEVLITDESKDNSPYTHFFRLPTRLQWRMNILISALICMYVCRRITDMEEDFIIIVSNYIWEH